jgi:hypothetical protein
MKRQRKGKERKREEYGPTIAAERSPQTMSTASSEQQEFQREFAWAIRLMVFLALLHIVLFAIILAAPK